MIKYLDLKAINEPYEHTADEVLRSGWYLKGDWTRRFEEAYAEYIGTRYCIGCGNGLDALTLIFRAYIEMGVMHEGDEVIVPANTYIASILAVTENRLKPVLVEPSLDTLQIDDTLIEQAITERTRAVMIVHLYGICAYTERIGEICSRHHLKLIEDNAQAHGLGCDALSLGCDALSLGCDTLSPGCDTLSPGCDAVLPHRKTGSLGSAAGHSFYPTKNLGAFGDAGAVTTDDAELAEMVRALGNYGSAKKYIFDYLGRNSRMDEIQAAILLAKLPHLNTWNERRREIASRYCEAINFASLYLRLDALDSVAKPSQCLRNSVYHIFPVFSPRRDELQQFLSENGIETQVHYPIPPHRQRCYPNWNNLSLPVSERIHAQELSIPCNQAMTDEDVDSVIEALNRWLR